MDWIKLVRELMEAGFTQSQIAERCGVAQASVSDLGLGKTKSPSFAFGSALVALHSDVVRPEKAAA